MLSVSELLGHYNLIEVEVRKISRRKYTIKSCQGSQETVEISKKMMKLNLSQTSNFVSYIPMGHGVE